ncbi:MAG: hypothetical protein KDG89_12280 [Geminicoccaceae bacterium]|nr:hypothetical protein [Geminicoccaceae bacterium]
MVLACASQPTVRPILCCRDLEFLARKWGDRVHVAYLHFPVQEALNALLPAVLKLAQGDAVLRGTDAKHFETYRVVLGASKADGKFLRERAIALASKSTDDELKIERVKAAIEKFIHGLRQMTPAEVAAVWLDWQRRARTANDPQMRMVAGETLKAILREVAWPSTDAPIRGGPFSFEDWLEQGLLSNLGYRVGRTRGLPAEERHEILDIVCREALPRILPKGHLAEWGEPETVQRILKTANCLAAFCRNAKRRDERSGRDSNAQAIREWEHDLAWLKDQWDLPPGDDWPDPDI